MKREPVMIAELVKAGAIAAAVFGLELTTEQIGALAIVAGLVAGWFTRGRVSPVAQ